MKITDNKKPIRKKKTEIKTTKKGKKIKTTKITMKNNELNNSFINF